METVSYVVGIDVCVVPLESVVEDGDDHSLSRDALLPDGDHVQVQLRQRGRRPRVLLDAEERKRKTLINYYNNKNTNPFLSLSDRFT